MHLSRNFTLEELCYSAVGSGLKVQNIPNDEQKFNLCRLVSLVLQPLRSYLGIPIKISSCYRSKELNRLVKGVRNSRHLHGLAVDIPYSNFDDSNFSVASRFLLNLKELGVIDEFIEEPTWFHISINPFY